MAAFKFTNKMAIEVGEMGQDMAQDFGRAFSDLLDFGVLGISVMHFFAPGEHTFNTMVGEFLDAGLSDQPEIQGHITPRYLSQEQLRGIQQAVTLPVRNSAAPRNNMAELEPTF